MKKVTRGQLLEMENVLYTSYEKDNLPFSPFQIKYSNIESSCTNNWVQEEFPIGTPCPDFTGLTGDHFELIDYLEVTPLGEEIPISDLETSGEGMYYPFDREYLVYSKEDICKLIKKLEQLL